MLYKIWRQFSDRRMRVPGRHLSSNLEVLSDDQSETVRSSVKVANIDGNKHETSGSSETDKQLTSCCKQLRQTVMAFSHLHLLLSLSVPCFINFHRQINVRTRAQLH